MSSRLGDLLVRRGMLTQDDLMAALDHQRTSGGRLGTILVERGVVSDKDIALVLSQQYDVPYVNLDEIEIEESVKSLIPMSKVFRHQLLPVQRNGTRLTIAITDPTNVMALDEIKFMTGLEIDSVVVAESQLRSALESIFGSEQALELQKVYDQLAAEVEYELELREDADDMDLGELQKATTEAPIIKLVNLIMGEAIRKGASDIHLEPYERETRVRYRIDGVLYNAMQPPQKFKDAIISRIKIMAHLDISERRLPQDGRIKMKVVEGVRRKEVDLRVSTLPTLFGEKVVLRILDKEKLPMDLASLGLEPGSMALFERNIHRPFGMILVTGPTGSGKSSTLYTCLNKLNSVDVNIMTAEDPAEYNFTGINQIQTKEQIGLTFAAALRSFLRQDPDIIMVGEVRDRETAEIAIKASLTGHLVLSTLHTNDAPSTINRLLNMGVEPFLVASSVNLICAQRLVRTICPECKQPIQTPVQALIDVGLPPAIAKQTVAQAGAGCQKCNDTGYKGRVGLFEVMEVTPKIKRMILTGADAVDIRRCAREEGMISLRESGLQKMRKGLTTLEEVLRVTTKD